MPPMQPTPRLQPIASLRPTALLRAGGATAAHAAIPGRSATARARSTKAPAVPHGATPKGAEPDLVYVVRPHDTLWALAGAHLGNPYRWVELFDLNRGRAEPGGSLVDPNLIYRGWTLQFPVGATDLLRDGTPRTANDRSYVVQPGDTLWALAAAHLGNPYRWVELFDLNRGRAEPGGRLVDSNLIYAGWMLEFPVGATGISSGATSTRATTAQRPENRPTPAVRKSLVAGKAAPRLHEAATRGAAGWSI